MNSMTMNRRRLLGSAVAGGALAVTLQSPIVRRAGAMSHQSPEASPSPTIPESLFDVTFLRDWQPEGKAQGAFYRITLQPGDELTYLPGPYCGCSGETIKEGTAAETITSGVYTVRLDRPFIVRHAGEDDQDIDADTEIALTSGDVAIYPDALAFGSLRNTGNEPVVIFGASITSIDVEAGTFTPPLPEDMSARLSVAVYDAWQTLGEGDIPARLTRRTLPAGETLGPWVIDGLEAIHAQTGEFHSSIIPPGQASPTGDPLFVREGGTAAFRKVTPGAQRFLQNQTDADAILLTLNFLPAT
ncbi:MAG: hypothetical protein AB7G88_15295 [Thermomicrobiales bacterium]